MKKEIRIYSLAAALGGLWFLLPFALDKGLQDFNYPTLPLFNFFSSVASVFAAMVSGVIMANIFSRCLLNKSKLYFFLLPIITLPVAIVLFSTFIWLIWRLSKTLNPALPTHDFIKIFSTYAIYGLLSIFSPLLYAAALITHWMFRKSLGEKR